jgi:hypothetical protein
MTTRRLMVVVACVGVLLAFGERWHRYKRLAAYHANLAMESEEEARKQHPPYLIWVPWLRQVSRFHLRKSAEYERAALSPWIVVKLESPPIEDVGWPPSTNADQFRPTPPAP